MAKIILIHPKCEIVFVAVFVDVYVSILLTIVIALPTKAITIFVDLSCWIYIVVAIVGRVIAIRKQYR